MKNVQHICWKQGVLEDDKTTILDVKICGDATYFSTGDFDDMLTFNDELIEILSKSVRFTESMQEKYKLVEFNEISINALEQDVKSFMKALCCDYSSLKCESRYE